MQLRGPLVGPDRWWYHTLLKGTIHDTLAIALASPYLAGAKATRTYCNARGPIYDVSVTDVRQVGHVDWPGSSSTNDTSILKPLEYPFDRRLYLYGEFAADRSHPVSPSFPATLLQLSQELYGSRPRRDFPNDRTEEFYQEEEEEKRTDGVANKEVLRKRHCWSN
ncbi:hypothetical protein HYC85_013228 [Camellia sinensis]|uniref:Uncharacterized protein n=1 Tax=Camellia sinensis TaxID=4442 RepID=A0A7J7H4Y1_CAMSI|nr:hypothetical protein HYC85_013228 [Camellia sinensis]